MRNGKIKKVEDHGTSIRIWIEDAETRDFRPYVGGRDLTLHALEMLFGSDSPIDKDIAYESNDGGLLRSIGEPNDGGTEPPR